MPPYERQEVESLEHMCHHLSGLPPTPLHHHPRLELRRKNGRESFLIIWMVAKSETFRLCLFHAKRKCNFCENPEINLVVTSPQPYLWLSFIQ